MAPFLIGRDPYSLLIAVFSIAVLPSQAIVANDSEGIRTPRFEIAQAQRLKGTPKDSQSSSGSKASNPKTPEAEVCDPASRKLDEISAALNKSQAQVQRSCATKSSPAQVRVGGALNRAIIVRPLAGDVDAILKKRGEIIDVSINRKQRTQLLLLPASGDFEVVVSTEAPSVSFEIGAVQITRPEQKKADARAPAQPMNTPSPAPVRQNGSEKGTVNPQEIPEWVPGGFRDLGYDVMDPASSTDDTANPIDLRTIMAFQAGEKFAVTGVLGPEHISRLANLVATNADLAAGEAMRTTRKLVQSSPVVIFPDPDASQSTPTISKKPAKKEDDEEDANVKRGLKSMKGAFFNGKFYGQGELQSGSKFEGEWLDGPAVGVAQRPALGVLFLANDCRAAIKTFGLPAPGDEGLGIDDSDIISNSIGVIRQKEKRLFVGDLRQVDSEQLQACLPPASQEKR